MRNIRNQGLVLTSIVALSTLFLIVFFKPNFTASTKEQEHTNAIHHSIIFVFLIVLRALHQRGLHQGEDGQHNLGIAWGLGIMGLMYAFFLRQDLGKENTDVAPTPDPLFNRN